MARREILVQLDDDLVDRLDEIAKARSTSRSAVLRDGARAMIDAHDDLVAFRDDVNSYRLMPDDDDFLKATARIAARTALDW